MAADKIVIAFDLYGTLLSTESIAEELAKNIGQEKAGNVAAAWRRYQLEYTWRLNSMNKTIPFSDVTKRSLLHALEDNKVVLNDDQVSALMRAYDSLKSFPDVPPALKELTKRKDKFTLVVFSNGTQSMVTNSVKTSPDLSSLSDAFDHIVTVDKVQKFKPAPEVYHYLAQQTGKNTDPQSMALMWLVSGNPFDVVGARSVGMKAAWVDRKGHHGSGTGWADKLVPREEGPSTIVKGLDELIVAIEEHS